jgi:hypothetical protein
LYCPDTSTGLARGGGGRRWGVSGREKSADQYHLRKHSKCNSAIKKGIIYHGHMGFVPGIQG